MALTTAQLIAQLYIGYYNRAPEPEGLDYWVGRVEAGVSLSDIADSFAASPEAIAAYPWLAMSNPSAGSVGAFLEAVYQNLFNRSIDADGLAFYSNELLTGLRSPGEIIASIQANANTNTNNTDGQILANKVTVGLAWYEGAKAQSGFEFNDAAKASANTILDGVGATQASVDAALATIEDLFGAPASLDAALADLFDAREALSDALADLELDTNLDGTIDVEAGDAEVGDVTSYFNAATAAVGAELNNPGFASAGAATQQGLINDGLKAAQDVITKETAELRTAEAGVSSALLTAINAVESRAAAFEVANDAAIAADVTEDGEAARFEAVNDGALAVTGGNTLEFTPAGGSAVTLATLTNGVWVANTTLPTGLVGFDAYLAALQAETTTATAATQAETALDNAVLRVLQLESGNANLTTTDIAPDAITDAQVDGRTVVTIDLAATGGTVAAPNAQGVLDARQDLVDAQEALADLQDAIEVWEAAGDLNDQISDLVEAVTAAEEAITNSPANGGLGLNLISENDAFTSADDVYLFTQDSGTTFTVANFGQIGDDVIYVGSAYTLVELAATDTLSTKAYGSATVLEVFIQQVGANTVLSFETAAFDGSDTDGSFNGTVITLTGVNADDVSFANGYFSIA
ncbi:protein of unknown function [Devosia crocina]|uniref:DUF4214 domain-containing protein n=1 Tax=Devosia crocina TaxID=429728 RepID=A0A1I7MWI4_9HYPH|nr:DUF4214 domain-containing protein [Devosia crocina]SFV26760.1 protein of unknown function [Devosia crocina]